MADTIEITMDEVQVAVNAPKNYAPFVLHKLFQLPYDMPMPEKFLFLEERQAGRPRTLIRNIDSTTIGLELYPTFDKASILAYITKASKSVVDVSVWKDVVVDPNDNPVPPEPEPEPEEPEVPEEPETPPTEPETPPVEPGPAEGEETNEGEQEETIPNPDEPETSDEQEGEVVDEGSEETAEEPEPQPS